jgi:hypothetical protein
VIKHIVLDKEFMLLTHTIIEKPAHQLACTFNDFTGSMFKESDEGWPCS